MENSTSIEETEQFDNPLKDKERVIAVTKRLQELRAVICDLFIQSNPWLESYLDHFTWFTGWKVQSVEPFNPQGSPEQRFIDGPYLVIIEVEVFNDGYDKQVVHYMKEVDVRYDFIAHELKLNLSLRENEKIVMWARQDDLIEGLKGFFRA